jgi:hypothetical protein
MFFMIHHQRSHPLTFRFLPDKFKMRKEIYIAPGYSDHTGSILNIPEIFASTGGVLHSGRNIIKQIETGDLRLAVKYFRKITFANRILFATLIKSKAKRTYDNTVMLLEKGFKSPAPVGYINTYRHGILSGCYFLSLFEESHPVDELFSRPVDECREALKSFGKFTFHLHKSGIIHNDYNLDNVLYASDNGEYTFSLIDNNRILLRDFRLKKGIRDLKRIYLPDDKLGILLGEYARAAGADYKYVSAYYTKIRNRMLLWKGLKRTIKSYFTKKNTR